MSDDELLTAFENCTLPFERWTHRAHVRVAFLYASQLNLDSATDRMRASVKAYNKATETPEAIDRGYHETITQAFMRLVVSANQQTGPHVSSIDFCEAHPELLTKYALQSFYSREHIMTMKAKAQFVEPDLCPLPIVVGDFIPTTADNEANRIAMNSATFSVSDVSKLRQNSEQAWLEFLNVPCLSMGVYHIAAGTNDRETHDPHDRDEVYVGISGKGRLTVDGEPSDVEAGTIVYVKAGVEHYFHDVTDDLTVLVFFSGETLVASDSK